MKRSTVLLVTLWVCLLVYDIKSEPAETPSRSKVRLSKILDVEELGPGLYELSVSRKQGKMLVEFVADRKGLLQSLRGVYLFRDQAPDTLWIPLVTAENGLSTNTTIRVKLTVPFDWSEDLSLFFGCNDIRESGTLYGVRGENVPFSLVEIPSSACIDSIQAARMIYDSSYCISLDRTPGAGALAPVSAPPGVETNAEIRIRLNR